MYISEEQKNLEKIDIDFKKKVKETKEFINSTLASISDLQKLEYSDKLEKVKKSTHKSKRLKIDNGVLIKNSASSETVFIPKGVTEIGNEASKNNRNVKIIFPEGLKKIGVSAFEDAASILYIDVKDTDLCYPAESVALAGAGDEIDQFSRGFSQFPDTLEEISDYAFRNLGQNSNGFSELLMEYLILPQSLKYIGRGAFLNSGIKAVYIAGPNTVSEYCFSKSGLRKVVFGDNVEVIEKIAFESCNKLEKIVFGRNIKKIGEYAFSYCLVLKKLELPSSLKKIGKGSFSECGRLTNVDIPDSVTEIGENAFSKCIDLKEVKIGVGITTIPSCCFSNCTSLKKIEIPESVASIDDLAFKNCDKLTIYAPLGSYAEQYAKENNFQFEAI